MTSFYKGKSKCDEQEKVKSEAEESIDEEKYNIRGRFDNFKNQIDL